MEESSLKTGSFEQSSFETNSFDKRSFEATSFSKSSFQEASLATDSFERTAFLQRQPSTSELAKLERGTLSTEPGQLGETALKKAALSLEPSFPAHLAATSFSTFLGGPRFFTSGAQGGVLKVEACLPQLDRDQLELVSIMGIGSSLAWLPCKRKLPPLQA